MGLVAIDSPIVRIEVVQSSMASLQRDVAPGPTTRYAKVQDELLQIDNAVQSNNPEKAEEILFQAKMALQQAQLSGEVASKPAVNSLHTAPAEGSEANKGVNLEEQA